ncbi:Proteophosphoglycan ppg4 [Meredithblackwellia eburnea MCA 4105]
MGSREKTTFASLPVDLLHSILAPLIRPGDLWGAALVSREWNIVTTPLLYGHLRLIGRDLDIVGKLFRTLVDAPQLCHLIRSLELRVYPISLILSERLETERQAAAILRSCVSLRVLRWTRKGALTDRVLEAITELPKLEVFELNGHTSLSPGSWSVKHLLRLPPLRTLSFILPDRLVADALPQILQDQVEKSGHGLDELTILCRESPVVNDKIMEACIPVLSQTGLRTLALAGCSKLSGAPILRLLPNLPQLQHLALEADNIAPSFYADFSRHLYRLLSLKVTHPGPRHAWADGFFPSLLTLLRGTPLLEAFTIYHSGAAGTGVREWAVVDDGFTRELSHVVGARLRKFECSGILMRPASIDELDCPLVRDLVIHLGYTIDLDRLRNTLATFRRLRTCHVMCQRTDIKPEDVRSLASRCSPTLAQIGWRNQVWHVKRVAVDISEEDAVVGNSMEPVRLSLERWNFPWWPEALLVVRTWCLGISPPISQSAEAFGAFRRHRYGAEDDSLIEED